MRSDPPATFECPCCGQIFELILSASTPKQITAKADSYYYGEPQGTQQSSTPEEQASKVVAFPGVGEKGSGF
jgi:hypothetical protein